MFFANFNLWFVIAFLMNPGVNFINIIRTNFSYKYDVLAALLVTFWLWQKIRTKNAREKTLMKLTADSVKALSTNGILFKKVMIDKTTLTLNTLSSSTSIA